MGMAGFHTGKINHPGCNFGRKRACTFGVIKTDLTWEGFQGHRYSTMVDMNNTINHIRGFYQGSINKIWLSFSFIVNMGFAESKPISVGPMLVTADETKKRDIQLRDLTVDKENCTAIVLESCTLKKKLRTELLSMGYSGDANQHVRRFIDGLFGKNNMMLFGYVNAWKIKFNSKDNFPSTLNLKNKNGGITLVPVTGHGVV
jgi:hypothetical protein